MLSVHGPVIFYVNSSCTVSCSWHHWCMCWGGEKFSRWKILFRWVIFRITIFFCSNSWHYEIIFTLSFYVDLMNFSGRNVGEVKKGKVLFSRSIYLRNWFDEGLDKLPFEQSKRKLLLPSDEAINKMCTDEDINTRFYDIIRLKWLFQVALLCHLQNERLSWLFSTISWFTQIGNERNTFMSAWVYSIHVIWRMMSSMEPTSVHDWLVKSRWSLRPRCTQRQSNSQFCIHLTSSVYIH